MYVVYALYSPGFDKIYIGQTSDLTKRLLQHNKLNKSGYTVRYRPWEVVYSESQTTLQDALRREKELKTSRGRDFIWQIVRDQYPN